jgi:hypothetical protein
MKQSNAMKTSKRLKNSVEVPATSPAQIPDGLSLGRFLLLLLTALGFSLLLQLGDELGLHHFLLLQEVIPLLVQLLLLGLGVQFNSFLPQFLGLFVEEDNSGDVLLTTHTLSFDEFLVALVIVCQLILSQPVLDKPDIFQRYWLIFGRSISKVVLEVQEN